MPNRSQRVAAALMVACALLGIFMLVKSDVTSMVDAWIDRHAEPVWVSPVKMQADWNELQQRAEAQKTTREK